MKKIDLAIRTLKEITLGNKKQDVIKSLEDGNIVLDIVTKIIWNQKKE